MLAKIYSLTLIGMDCETVEVEVDISNGIGSFTVVGLGDTAIQESRERVRSAIKNTNYKFPLARITVNLAPASIRKNGVFYDLPIALGVLIARGQCKLKEDISKTLFVGELALNGELRHVTGVLAMAIHAKEKGFTRIVVPAQNGKEASLIRGIEVIPAHTLQEVVEFLNQEKTIEAVEALDITELQNSFDFPVDFAQIKGQHQAKRALEIAAAGGPNILLNGAPGSGKTLMAKGFQSILPKITLDEALETTKIYSIANKLPANTPLITQRPFRSIHHTASAISIIGGGRIPMPGEISLSHKGVLFMDEFAEFSSQVLEVLRQPLEDKNISVTRVNGSSTFPADFILIAAMNPCSCGFYGVPDTKKECICSAQQIQRYQKKISGPILDRIDLYIDISPVKYNQLTSSEDGESSEIIQERVQKAKDIQTQRFQKLKISSNSEMESKEIQDFCNIPEDAKQLLKLAVQQMNLSARAYNRILKISRTIADISGNNDITTDHVAEALQYRKKG